ncbi:MAG: site-specific DNA-methyltransferase [Candidatus Marinimicrobia bacterium]|nr:site-specific DNA-methyltransferase [Candidatus Neomarinimicrobiota bacterium]
MIDKYINSVIQRDCLEVMRNIPDESVDITFADPPFNLKKKYNGYKDNKEFNTYLKWCKCWIYEMVRITKSTGSIFVHNIPKWLTYYSDILNEIAYFKHWIAWDAPTSPMGKMLQPSHYGVLFYAKDREKLKFYEIRHPHKRDRRTGYLQKDYGGKKSSLHPFGPLVSDVWTDIHRIKHNKYRDDHPCQLPIHLLERIILMSTDEGDIVLDPFVGTGTTAIAAKRLGRKYIGFDIDKNYISIAEKHLLQEIIKSRIGNVWVSFFLNEVVTIRDKDWKELSKYYSLPKSNKEIDYTKIELKNKSEIILHINNGGDKAEKRNNRIQQTLFKQKEELL